jgi:hypothetical protein
MSVRYSEAGLGVTRTARLTDREAARYAYDLQIDRKHADYGFGIVPEPYTVATVDERLTWADRLVEDLKTLL